MTNRTRNLLGAVPLLVWYAWGLWKETPILVAQYVALTNGASSLNLLGLIAQGLGIVFTVFVAVLLLVRDVPQASTLGFIPYGAAYVGTFASVSVFFLPHASMTPLLIVTSLLLLIVSLSLAMYALMYLGRSFAILPSARALVTTGPYRLVRHPLYLFEELSMIGLMLQFTLPWSLGILLVHGTAQLVRMHYEEKILSDTFPDYAAYCAKTKRIIPGIY